MSFETYLDQLPLLHSWDGGATWNTGGFSPTQLRRMHDIVRAQFPDRPVRVIETGAGNSTLTFLHLDVEQLVTIAPSDTLRDRILAAAEERSIDTGPLDFRVARSEFELPPMVLASDRTGWQTPTDLPRFDVALIDGAHQWPNVFVDFCYLNMMLGTGGLLLVDDVNLHSIAELSRLLAQQPGFELRHDLEKLEVWEKTSDELFLPDHSEQPYIMERTRAAASPAAAGTNAAEAAAVSAVRQATKAAHRARSLAGRAKRELRGRLGR